MFQLFMPPKVFSILNKQAITIEVRVRVRMTTISKKRN